MFSKDSIEEKKNQSGHAQEFISYYQQEMQRNISEIRRLISDVRDESDAERLLKEIQNVGNAMSDLAMVYGFENEEAMGRKIACIADACHPDNGLDAALSELDESTKAVEEAMLQISDSHNEHIGSPSEKNLAEDSTNVEIDEVVIKEESETLLFDIREDEKLISYLEDAHEGAITIDSASDSTTIEFDDSGNRELGFDIPKEDENGPGIGLSFAELDTDVMEIDFRESPPTKENESKNLLRRITGFFGFKGRKGF
jgi:hypothetical protein